MPHRLQLPRQPLRAGTCFHADDGSLSVFKECKQRIPPEPGALNDRAGRIGADEVKDILAQVDPVNGCAARFVANHLSSSC